MSSVVEWRHGGKRLLLPILILPPAVHDLRTIDALALLDTGATTSGITAELAAELDLPVLGKRPMSFANADAQVERYVFRIGLSLDGTKPVFPEIEGFRMRSAFTFNAILGMDLLSQCDLTIRRDGFCSLRFA